MVLCWRRHGRAGGCQHKKKTEEILMSIEGLRETESRTRDSRLIGDQRLQGTVVSDD